MSSAYHAASNGRAEVAVKAVKRAIRDNVNDDGSLNTDKILRAILLLRNTPDRESGMSPAQLLLGRPLRDTLPRPETPWGRYESPRHRGGGKVPGQDRWHDMWDEQEMVRRHRLIKEVDKLEAKVQVSRSLVKHDFSETSRNLSFLCQTL